MADELQQSFPESLPENPLTGVQSPTQKSHKKLWIILGIAGIGIILCIALIIAAIAFGLGKIANEKAPVATVLNSLMLDMAARDTGKAYSLFSSRAKRQFPESKLLDMLKGNNYVLFEGYLSLNIESINISAVVNSNPDVPQGTVAKVSGTIVYVGDIKGTFTGTLEKVDGEWKVDGFNVNVPPGKFN